MDEDHADASQGVEGLTARTAQREYFGYKAETSSAWFDAAGQDRRSNHLTF